MVREGEPPTTLQRWTGAKEVVGGLPAQTMTEIFLCGWCVVAWGRIFAREGANARRGWVWRLGGCDDHGKVRRLMKLGDQATGKDVAQDPNGEAE